MKLLISGGTGFIGQALVNHQLAQGHEVTVVSRSRQTISKVFESQPPVKGLTWKTVEVEGSALLGEFDGVINLAGANLGKRLWTQRYQATIKNSRLASTNTLAQACAQLGSRAPFLLNASAIGIYGLQTTQKGQLPEPFDENTDIDFDNPPDFLSTVGRAWERATWPAKRAGCRVVNMRFGVVLGPGGGVLPMIQLPFHFFLGGPIGQGDQPFSWIALSDLINAIDFIIQTDTIEGPVNLVSRHCVRQRELAKALGQQMQRPAWFKTPAFLMRLTLGQMAEELLLNGQHVKPTVLTQKGFQFEYPRIEDALRYALKRE